MGSGDESSGGCRGDDPTYVAECDARLKEQMIERGFSADEIVRVVNAGAAPARAPKAPPRTSDAAYACCPKPFVS
jgi:hypothetical protein